jgi:hypothetical protein
MVINDRTGELRGFEIFGSDSRQTVGPGLLQIRVDCSPTDLLVISPGSSLDISPKSQKQGRDRSLVVWIVSRHIYTVHSLV